MDTTAKRQDAIAHLSRLIQGIPLAMVTTRSDDIGLRSRPMVNVNSRFDGDLWFLTAKSDSKVAEIQHNPEVNVSFADPESRRFVSITGTAEVEVGRKRVELLWTPDCEEWLPHGEDAEEVCALRISISTAEYWDHKTRSWGGVLLGIATGAPVHVDEHAQLTWERTEGNSPVPAEKS